MSAASQGRGYRAAAAIVNRWGAAYTNGLPDSIADDRRSELASDLHEHGAAFHTRRSVGWSVARRAVAGIPADLSWRYTIRRTADRAAGVGFAGRWERDGSVVVAACVGVALLAWGLYVLGRVAVGTRRGAGLPGDDIWILVLLSTVADVCGLVLLARRAKRWVGALWLAAAAYGLIRYGMKALIYMSVTAYSIFVNVPFTDQANQLLVIFVCLFFAANAVLWAGAPHRQ